MAEISLHAYLDYLEDRLSRDAYSEVVAHCRHILEAYPKHLETYKLLARALSAQAEGQDAQDLFQRVLSADPNDFVAHIGMSDTYRESNNIEQAIWHLERAFEQAPNNMELQDEIKRLYEQKGDRAPRKIHLTSGALARMYLKGKLFDQAIAEIRAGISKDPERLDLQVLLADALWQSHEEVNAGQVAAEILKRLPYSLDANRILAQMWIKYKRPSEARPFLERVGELDPYMRYRIEHGQEPQSEAFRLTMLDFSPEQYAARTGAADWVSQIGAIEKQKGVTGPLPSADRSSITDIFLTPSSETTAAGPEEIPDWLRGTLGETAPGGGAGLPPAQDQEPEWLREALGKPAASAQPLEIPTDEDVPDWLKESLAGSSAQPPAAPSPISARMEPSTEAPDWLQETPRGAPTAPPTPSGGEEAPDWLQGMLTGEQQPPAEPAVPPASTGEAVPDWLREIQSSQPGEADAERDAQGVPDWLGDILSEKPTEATPTPQASATDVVSDDWLESFLAGGPPLAVPGGQREEPAPPEPTPEPEAPVMELETWDGPLPAALMKEEEEEQAPLPEWLQAAPPVSESPSATRILADEDEEELPEWLTASAPASTGAEQEPILSAEEEELPEWLQPIAGEPAETRSETTIPAEEAKSALPGWMETGSLLGGEPQREAEPQEEAALPDWLSGVEEAEEAELPDWLAGVGAEATPLPAAQPEAAPVSDELPDWLSGDEEAEEAELPDWLSGVEEAEAAPTPTLEPAGDELPGWLSGDEEVEEAELSDWLTGAKAEAAPSPALEPAGDELPDWLSGEEEAEEAELPDWLTGAKAEAAPSPAESPELERLSWLTDAEAPKEPEPEAAHAELPDWLLEDEGEEAAPAPTAAEKEELEPISEMPDWLTMGEQEEPAPALTSAEAVEEEPEPISEMPDWLTTMQEQEEEIQQPEQVTGEEEPALAAPAMPAFQEETEVAPPNEEPMGEDETEGIPDWMLEGDLDDSDAAVKWLEEIAAKYDPSFAAGQESEAAAEEPVAAKAEEAEEALPEWLKGMPESDEELDWLRAPTEGEPAAEQKPETAEELPSWLLEEEEVEKEAISELPSWLSGEEKEQEAPQPTALSRESEAEFAWLDEQVTAQGVSPTGVISEELTPDHPPTAAPPPPPPDAEAEPVSDEELPEWLRGEEIKMEMERAETAPVGEFDELPELDVEDEELAWLDEALKAEGGAKAEAGEEELEKLLAEEFEEEKLPSWLLEEEEEEEIPAFAAASAAEEREEAEEEEEALPSWLTEMEMGEPAGEATARAEIAMTEGAPAEEPEVPRIEEPAAEEALPAWLQASPDTAVDTGLDEFLRAAVPAAREPERAPQAPPPPEPPKPAPLPVTAPLSPPPRVEAPAPTPTAAVDLQGARTKMQEGYAEEALNSYEQLVLANQSLDDTIADLSDYVKGRRPNPRAYRIIGDAMMAQGKLNDALDMYRRALDQF